MWPLVCELDVILAYISSQALQATAKSLGINILENMDRDDLIKEILYNVGKEVGYDVILSTLQKILLVQRNAGDLAYLAHIERLFGAMENNERLGKNVDHTKSQIELFNQINATPSFRRNGNFTTTNPNNHSAYTVKPSGNSTLQNNVNISNWIDGFTRSTIQNSTDRYPAPPISNSFGATNSTGQLLPDLNNSAHQTPSRVNNYVPNETNVIPRNITNSNSLPLATEAQELNLPGRGKRKRQTQIHEYFAPTRPISRFRAYHYVSSQVNIILPPNPNINQVAFNRDIANSMVTSLFDSQIPPNYSTSLTENPFPSSTRSIHTPTPASIKNATNEALRKFIPDRFERSMFYKDVKILSKQIIHNFGQVSFQLTEADAAVLDLIDVHSGLKLHRLYLLAGYLPEYIGKPVKLEYPEVMTFKVNNKKVEWDSKYPIPLDLTNLVDYQIQNVVDVEFFNARTNMVFFLELVRQIPDSQLSDCLLNNRYLSKDVILETMKAKIQDQEIQTINEIIPIKDPLSQVKIAVPARSSKCVHTQCFEASTFYALNRLKPKWECPICYIVMQPHDLFVDGYMHEVIKNTSKDCESVELKPDGSWEEVKKQFEVPTKKQKPIEIICID